MNRSKYWVEREAKEKEKLLDRAIADTERELRAEYKKTAKKIKNELQALYVEILEANNDGTLLASDLYRFNRYYEFQNFLNKELRRLGEKETQIYEEKFTKLYLHNGEILNKHLGLNTKLDTEAATRTINSIWCTDGKTWKTRVSTNLAQTQSKIKQTLIDCVATGKNYQEASKMLAHQLGTTYINAERIVRTEMAHIQNQSSLDKYKEAGIEEYEVIMEENACDDCKEYENQTISINTSVFPLHPNCRCCVVPVLKADLEI